MINDADFNFCRNKPTEVGLTPATKRLIEDIKEKDPIRWELLFRKKNSSM